MGIIETKSFKSGNSVAVRLPAELGIPAGVTMEIERIGAELRITLRDDEAARLDRFKQMVERLSALPPIPLDPNVSREEERLEFPDRPGLY